MSGSTLAPLLRPRSIAVVGASRNPTAIGHQILSNIVDHAFTGTVYPVNPNAAAVKAVHAYPSVRDLPEVPDLAVIVVPKESVVAAAESCGLAGVRGLLVISAGFREIGGAGIEREHALVQVVRKYGMRMIGPNCLGFVNTDPAVSLNATFAQVTPPSGNIAFMSQSGALGLSVLDYAREFGIGIAQFVSVGNKPDVSGNDLLEEWEHDDSIATILMYVESFGNPRRFLDIASRITRTKPIIALKAGRSAAGARAAGSHTGALAVPDAVVTGLLEQAGVMRASTVEELFDIAAAFSARALPRTNRTCVVTNAGGPGILVADALSAHGLVLPQLAEETVARLQPLLPEEASLRNPLDLIASAQPESFGWALEALLDADDIDSALAVFVPPMGVRQEHVAHAICSAAARHPDKPIVAVLMGREGLPAGREQLRAAGIPAYVFPESAAHALSVLVQHKRNACATCSPSPRFERDAAGAMSVIRSARSRGAQNLTQTEVFRILQSYGVPVIRHEFVRSAEEAGRAAESVGLPVALKVVAEGVQHKTEVDGLRLFLQTPAAVRTAYESMLDAVTEAVPDVDILGAIVQPMLPPAREWIAGISNVPQFGPVVMFGAGGVYVEMLKDVAFRLAPVDMESALDMQRRIHAAPLLGAVRGKPAVDTTQLAEVLVRLSMIAVELPDIAELDINPLMTTETGAVLAVDVRAVLTNITPQA